MTRRAFKKRVFLSHSHADKPFVEMVAQDLDSSGLRVWYDKLDLVLGDSLTAKIEQAIGASVCVAVFLSPDSVRSEWVEREVALAMRCEAETGKVVVLPLLLRGLCDSDIPPALAGRLGVDFRQPPLYDSAVRRLLDAFKPGRAPRGGFRIWEQDEAALSFDGARRARLARAAAAPNMAEWVLDYLTTVSARSDPTERYWAYITLSDVGGPRAAAALLEGLFDPNDFARRGAADGLRRLRAKCPRSDDAPGGRDDVDEEKNDDGNDTQN